ncbi:MAG: hypothetical protein OXG56_08455 [Gammaproteobacteria bacterium]|nr:hypothetical protein [Gammaproteobacteria bacterium]
MMMLAFLIDQIQLRYYAVFNRGRQGVYSRKPTLAEDAGILRWLSGPPLGRPVRKHCAWIRRGGPVAPKSALTEVVTEWAPGNSSAK